MLKPAIKNTNISIQNTIVPMIDGTVRRMFMCDIDSDNPLRSAARCKPARSHSTVIAWATSLRNEVARH